MEKYTVQTGDSLWKISRKFNINIHELASINRLNTKAEQHIIHPGQVLNLPTKDKPYDTQLDLKLYDLAWRPLKSAKVRLMFDSKTHGYVTDGTGSVAGLLIEDSSKGIKVELQHLNQKDYIVIANHEKLPLGKKTLKISSREMIVKGSTSAEKGTQQSTKQQEKEKAKQGSKESSKSGADKNTKEKTQPEINKTTRTEGGAPTSVSNIGNVSEGLRLPPEAEQYRDYIIDTAKKYGFQPEGLAALIYAESRWKASASNASGSGAVGLGQFKPNTWLTMCTDPQSKVYQMLTKKYSYKTLEYTGGKLYGVLPSDIKEEVSRSAVLELRINPEYNIDLIGLYDKRGIDSIATALPSTSTLEPDEVIKLAYLIHHNGENGAYDIIMNGVQVAGNYKVYTDEDLKVRLKNNVSSDVYHRYLSIDERGRTAYVAWLITHYNSIIVPDDYRVIPKKQKSNLKDILKKLNPNFEINTNLPEPNVRSTSPSVQQPDNNAPTQSSEKWHNPMDICKIRTHKLPSPVGASFGSDVRHDSQGRPKAHQGVDIEAAPGTPIYSVADGRVAFVKNNGDYGMQLCIIVHTNDLPQEKNNLCQYEDEKLNVVYFFYAHLSEINSNLSGNSLVKCGDIIGRTGSTGNANNMTSILLGSHLHFEVRKIERTGRGIANRIDPAPFIDGFNFP